MSTSPIPSVHLPVGVPLAALLGSQADSFEAQLHARATTAAPSSASASTLAAPKAKRAAGARSPALQPLQTPSAALRPPFTHTLHTTHGLSSLLALSAPAAAASSSASAAAAPKSLSRSVGGALQLQGSLESAQSLLAQLLPTSVEDTPKPAQFHALLLRYLDACGARAAEAGAAAVSVSSEKDKKRKRADDKADGSAAVSPASVSGSALHAVSTTVIGRLAARCIQLLSDSAPSAGRASFDASLLQCPSSYWSVLALLLRSDSLSARFTPTLFPLLTRHHALPLIESALVHIHDAAERDLVELTKYALDNLPTPAVSTRTLPLKHAAADTAAPAPPSKRQRRQAASAMIDRSLLQHPVHVIDVPGGSFAVILDLLLTSPLSATFLRVSLSSLSPKHAHKLLRYLYAWTLRYWLHTDKELHSAIHAISKEARSAAAASAASAAAAGGASGAQAASVGSFGFRVPSLSQLVDWMNILLDAVDFVTVHRKEEAAHERNGAQDDSADSLSLRDLLASLAAHVSHHHLQLVEDSQDLKGFLSLFALLKRTPNAAPLPQPPIQDYQLEVLELGA